MKVRSFSFQKSGHSYNGLLEALASGVNIFQEYDNDTNSNADGIVGIYFHSSWLEWILCPIPARKEG
jgi:hypothetical protein